MPGRTPLDPAALAAALAGLPGWHLADGPDGGGVGSNRIVRTFRRGDFRGAVAFLVRVAFEAEALDHHPEITNVYDRVTLALATHDAGDRVTEMDLELARRIDALAS
jgi:4a-hydroxytetrahydrobiopterin dehydratase